MNNHKNTPILAMKVHQTIMNLCGQSVFKPNINYIKIEDEEHSPVRRWRKQKRPLKKVIHQSTREIMAEIGKILAHITKENHSGAVRRVFILNDFHLLSTFKPYFITSLPIMIIFFIIPAC